MISLIASASDSNPAGASQFVAIPVPVGVQCGDLAIVAIALPASGMTVTPPDSGWTQLVQTDTTQAFGVVVFWTMVLNLQQVNWVFALSSSVQATGVATVYRGTDSFAPIDASVALLSASGTSHAVAGVSTQQPAEEVVLFVAGAASGTYTPPSGWTEAAKKQQSGSSISAQHRQVQPAGALAGFSETFSASVLGASVVIALAPSPGTMTFADAYQRVFDSLPPGIDNVLDFTPGSGDFWKLTWAIGAVLKLFVFDLVDLLRSETLAHLSRYKLPDWEGLFGLRGSRVSQIGTIAARRAQVLGAWRSAAGQGSSIPVTQAVLTPLLGYNPSTLPLVIECDRSLLKLLHQYDTANGSDVSIPVGTTTLTIPVIGDGGKVAKMGAQLELAFATADTTLFSFTLTAPDGTSKTWNAGTTSGPLWLQAPSLAGAAIQGNWTLAITNGSGSPTTLYSASFLFVEGVQQGQQTAGAAYDWGVYADPAHLAENGTVIDLSAARAAIKKLSFSYTIGNLIQSLAPSPNVDTGASAAIPDECIPV